jgi:hypothetical protein
MRLDLNLIRKLQEIDPRIIYLSVQDKHLDDKGIDELVINQYATSDRIQLLKRGSTFYLSDDGNLPFSHEDVEQAKEKIKFRGTLSPESPLKNIIDCLNEGTEKQEDYILSVLNIRDSRGYICYSHARDSTKLFRGVFPTYKSKIVSGLIIFDDSVLLKEGSDNYFRALPPGIEKRKKCIKNIIVLDL